MGHHLGVMHRRDDDRRQPGDAGRRQHGVHRQEERGRQQQHGGEGDRGGPVGYDRA
jgi:hypothetical protein